MAGGDKQQAWREALTKAGAPLLPAFISLIHLLSSSSHRSSSSAAYSSSMTACLPPRDCRRRGNVKATISIKHIAHVGRPPSSDLRNASGTLTRHGASHERLWTIVKKRLFLSSNCLLLLKSAETTKSMNVLPSNASNVLNCHIHQPAFLVKLASNLRLLGTFIRGNLCVHQQFDFSPGHVAQKPLRNTERLGWRSTSRAH